MLYTSPLSILSETIAGYLGEAEIGVMPCVSLVIFFFLYSVSRKDPWIGKDILFYLTNPVEIYFIRKHIWNKVAAIRLFLFCLRNKRKPAKL